MTTNNPLKRGAAGGASDSADAAIYDLLGYNAIAKAGQPVSLTGESLVQVGAIISQLDFDDPLEEEVAEQDEVRKKERKKEDVRLDAEMTGPEFSTPIIELPGKKEINLAKPNARVQPKITTTPPKTPEGEFGTMLQPGGTFTKKPDVTVPEEKGRTYFAAVPGGGGLRLSSVPVRQRSLGEIFTSVKDYLFGDTDDTPTKRLPKEVLDSLEPLRYSAGKFKDTPLKRVMHAVQTPFLKTDGLNYGQIKRAVMPASIQGRLGSAAADGFNLVADTYNYSIAVKNEFNKELDDEFGSLEVEDVNFTSNKSRQDYLKLGFQKKKELYDSFRDYRQGNISYLDYQNKRDSLKSQLNAAAATRNNLTALRKEFQDNKDNYDINASDPEMIDFYNTLDKNPERLSIVSKKGADYVVGQTLGGKPISVPTTAIANGTAGFRLVQKESLDPIVAGAGTAIDNFNKGKEFVKTEYGIGTQDITPDQAKTIGVNYIKNALLQNKEKARSYMSQIGVDYGAYEQFAKNNNFPDDFLTDAATELYEQRIAPFYQQQSQTKRFSTQTKPSRGSAAERTQKQMLTKYNSTGLPTPSNILDYSIDVLGGKDFEVRELDDGTYGIFKQGTEDTLSILDLSKPEQAKKILFNYAGLKPYSLPTKK